MTATNSDQFFWQDHQGDAGVRACRLATQGVWMQLLCIAGLSEKKGFVLINGKKPKLSELVRVVGGTEAEVSAAIYELKKYGVCSFDAKGVMYCRRMVKKEKARQASAKGGRIGGPKSQQTGVGIHAGRECGDPVDNPDRTPVDKSPASGDGFISGSKSDQKVENTIIFEFDLNDGNNSEIHGTRGATRGGTRDGARHPYYPVPSKEESKSFNAVRVGNGKSGDFTLQNPEDRISRFQQKIARQLGRNGWMIVQAACDERLPMHEEALALCKNAAKEIGKGWPLNWPKAQLGEQEQVA